MNKVIDRIKEKYLGTIVIDPKLVMCNSSECITSIANTALYKDANHLNTKAAKLFAEHYVGSTGNPFLRPTDDLSKLATSAQ